MLARSGAAAAGDSAEVGLLLGFGAHSCDAALLKPGCTRREVAVSKATFPKDISIAGAQNHA
jgi:hypothetical protein